MKNDFDIIVVGGGHAGIEAAWISASFKLKVALISLPDVPIASAPCNPAIGGIGKGQVVREIDALGGIMGRISDLSAIQYRTLNESKGYAVQSTRVQIDKLKYSEIAEKILDSCESLTILREKVGGIKAEDDGSFLITTEKNHYTTAKVIITAGTFLKGKLHIGDTTYVGGRLGAETSESMDGLCNNPIKVMRFKTGTPARVLKDSVDVSSMEVQNSDNSVINFHYNHLGNERFLQQVDCYLARTNIETMKIIRDAKDRSPLFNGKICGVGPRYCPSIEDKAFRYPDRNTHHVFIEPEGLTLNTMYPNGLSTSLPKDVQLSFLRSIQGLEKVEIETYGYAVEYDVIDTTALNGTLEFQKIPGLYFAGQVNGTSGYEEAAAQGLISGVNAALSFKNKKPLIIPRNESYIGVLIEDLITNIRDEPYRLFTARSENRLYIREDNAIQRLALYRKMLGLNTEVDLFHKKFILEYNLLSSLVNQITYSPKDFDKKLQKQFTKTITQNTTLHSLLKMSESDPVAFLKEELVIHGLSFMESVARSVAIDTKYDGYIKRSNNENLRMKKLDKRQVKWSMLIDSQNISYECRARIEQIKPETFAQLRNIEGIRPATLAYVAGVIHR